jgi:hypothetical protein
MHPIEERRRTERLAEELVEIFNRNFNQDENGEPFRVGECETQFRIDVYQTDYLEALSYTAAPDAVENLSQDDDRVHDYITIGLDSEGTLGYNGDRRVFPDGRTVAGIKPGSEGEWIEWGLINELGESMGIPERIAGEWNLETEDNDPLDATDPDNHQVRQRHVDYIIAALSDEQKEMIRECCE